MGDGVTSVLTVRTMYVYELKSILYLFDPMTSTMLSNEVFAKFSPWRSSRGQSDHPTQSSHSAIDWGRTVCVHHSNAMTITKSLVRLAMALAFVSAVTMTGAVTAADNTRLSLARLIEDNFDAHEAAMNHLSNTTDVGKFPGSCGACLAFTEASCVVACDLVSVCARVASDQARCQWHTLRTFRPSHAASASSSLTFL